MAKQDEQTLKEYEGRYDEILGLFGLMLPMDGAIDAVHRLNEHYDCYILSQPCSFAVSAMLEK